MPWARKRGRWHEFSADIRVGVRFRDLARDGAFRANVSVSEFCEAAIAAKHWHDIRERHHRAAEERRLAQQEAPTRSENPT